MTHESLLYPQSGIKQFEKTWLVCPGGSLESEADQAIYEKLI